MKRLWRGIAGFRQFARTPAGHMVIGAVLVTQGFQYFAAGTVTRLDALEERGPGAPVDDLVTIGDMVRMKHDILVTLGHAAADDVEDGS